MKSGFDFCFFFFDELHLTTIESKSIALHCQNSASKLLVFPISLVMEPLVKFCSILLALSEVEDVK